MPTKPVKCPVCLKVEKTPKGKKATGKYACRCAEAFRAAAAVVKA